MVKAICPHCLHENNFSARIRGNRVCFKCKKRFTPNEEESLLSAITNRDEKLIKEIEKKAMQGDVVRLI